MLCQHLTAKAPPLLYLAIALVGMGVIVFGLGFIIDLKYIRVKREGAQTTATVVNKIEYEVYDYDEEEYDFEYDYFVEYEDSGVLKTEQLSRRSDDSIRIGEYIKNILHAKQS